MRTLFLQVPIQSNKVNGVKLAGLDVSILAERLEEKFQHLFNAGKRVPRSL